MCMLALLRSLIIRQYYRYKDTRKQIKGDLLLMLFYACSHAIVDFAPFGVFRLGQLTDGRWQVQTS